MRKITTFYLCLKKDWLEVRRPKQENFEREKGRVSSVSLSLVVIALNMQLNENRMIKKVLTEE